MDAEYTVYTLDFVDSCEIPVVQETYLDGLGSKIQIFCIERLIFLTCTKYWSKNRYVHFANAETSSVMECPV